MEVILKAKSVSGASFDDEQKKIIHDKIEVVKMKTKGDKKARFYNVPIPCYDEMEFVFADKHATGAISVLQAPFDCPPRHDDDLITNGRPVPVQMDGTDPDTLPGCDSPKCVGTKHKTKGKEKQRKRAKLYYALIEDVTRAMNLSDTTRFTHVTDPNEGIYKAIDDMEENPLPVRLDLLTYLAQNVNIASMLKGRPEETIKEWVTQWVKGRYPTGY